MASTKRLPVNVKQVNYYDGQNITELELETDQNRHVDIDAANVANFFGSGVMPDELVSNIIFDSDDLNTSQQVLFDSYDFDGQNVYIGSVPDVSDTTKGEQLAITLTDVELSGAAKTRISIIGDEFGGSLIHDDLTFEENGTQITRGRYKSIRAIIFQGFFGNLSGSPKYALNDDYSTLGRCIIREASALEISADPIMVSQMEQPNVFFNSYDYYPASSFSTIQLMLTDAVGADKDVGDLDIGLSSVSQRSLVPNDVTTKIGQKFQASGNNIQKISVLLSVEEDIAALPGAEYDFSGNITMTIHELQSSVSCPTTPTPDNMIDFDPNPAVVGQLSFSQADLLDKGVVLDGYAKVVDFVFTETILSDPVRSPIVSGNYYVFTLSRTGSTGTGTILIEEVGDRIDNSYMTVFDGSRWVNVTTSDMWFAIYGDYIKASDGLVYEEGIGAEIPKTDADSTNTEVPYVEGHISYYTSAYDSYNYILAERTTAYSDVEQSPTSGTPVYSRQSPSLNISALSSTDFTTLLTTDNDPIILARVKDLNPRGNPSQITGTTSVVGLVYGGQITILRPDADLRNHNLVGSILTPNTSTSSKYRIIKQELFTDSYGDVNGDGEIDASDLLEIQSWLPDGYGYELVAADQTKIINGEMPIDWLLRADVNADGYVDGTDAALISDYLDGTISTFSAGSTFQRMVLTVEALSDPLNTSVDMPASDATFTTTLFTGPVSFSIDYIPTWLPDRLVAWDTRRFIPTTFIESPTIDSPDGYNDFYIPNNLIIDKGQILDADGTHHSIDFEVNQIILNMSIDGYTEILNKSVLLFDNLVAESSDGKTAGGFDAMKYADGTYVQLTDFEANKVKIAPSLQSAVSSLSVPFAANIDDYVGVDYDPSSSLMSIYMKNLYDDYGGGSLIPALETKVIVDVYLKKAGFANEVLEVTSDQMRNLLYQNAKELRCPLMLICLH